MEFKIRGGNENATVTLTNERTSDGITYVDVNLHFDSETVPEPFKLIFYVPDIDCYSVWSPKFDNNDLRCMAPNWRKKVTKSRLASGMPLHSVISLGGKNRLTLAVSDPKTPITLATGVIEEGARVECYVEFFSKPTTAICDYTATLRMDMRDIDYYDSIYDAVSWWENDFGYKSAYVPEHAKLPMNSLWYSFHQELDPDQIVRQCELSKPLGMETVIIDDGWQTDDNNRGYAFCGDWELATGKIPDMRNLVDRIHNVGMKVMLWYSVPYIGIYAKTFEKFKDMRLNPASRSKHFALDPRYKEVRDYLVKVYATAVKEWGLDGLKLDFIDAFALTDESIKPDPRRDYASLEDAVDVLMKEVTDALYAINPEILIEFRQSYIGPTIRKYGNMLRAGDCPNDALKNKMSVVDLRLTSGKTAVHSDMLMWHYDDTVESAALQFTAILFSVPQISVLIDKLSDSHYKMLKHYLKFWLDNREVLLDGKLTATTPESFFGTVSSTLGNKTVTALYSDPVAVKQSEETIVVNSCHSEKIYLDGFMGQKYIVTDCMGEFVSEGTLDALSAIEVPTAGIVYIK